MILSAKAIDIFIIFPIKFRKSIQKWTDKAVIPHADVVKAIEKLSNVQNMELNVSARIRRIKKVKNFQKVTQTVVDWYSYAFRG